MGLCDPESWEEPEYPACLANYDFTLAPGVKVPPGPPSPTPLTLNPTPYTLNP